MVRRERPADPHENDPLTPVLDAIPLAILLIDRSLKIRWVNSRGETLFARTRNLLIGHPVRPPHSGLWTCSQGPAVDETIRTLFRGADPICGQERRYTIPVNGREREYHLRINASLISFAREPMVLMTLEDMTPTNQSEDNDTETEKLSLAIQMARATTHELNQPLSVLTGHLDLLMSRGEIDGPVKDRIDRISRSADRVTEVVRRLQEILHSPGGHDTLKAARVDSANPSLIV